MLGILLNQICVAIDTGTFIVPALLGHGIATHSNDVVATIVQVFRHVVLLRGIATGFSTQIETIAEHLGIAEYAVEADADGLALILLCGGEVLAIPADRVLRIFPAHLLIAVRMAGLPAVRQVHHPVMRQINVRP